MSVKIKKYVPLLLVTAGFVSALLVAAADVTAAGDPPVLAVCEVVDHLSGVTLNVLLRLSTWRS